ncbi:hypothetical protein [Actinocorallia longicatena]|uniref:hypothetical protein n=1 Tax=Actinocorallia longicatena TaxID=111803 RepID=UPI0031CFE883
MLQLGQTGRLGVDLGFELGGAGLDVVGELGVGARRFEAAQEVRPAGPEFGHRFLCGFDRGIPLD